MRTAYGEFDAENDADTDSVVVDDCADCVVGDADQPNARFGWKAALKQARRWSLSTRTKAVTAEEH